MATSCLYILVTILVGQVACMTIPPPPPVSDSAADSVAGWAGQDGMSPPPYFDPGTTTPAQDPNTVTPGTEPPPGGRGAQSQDIHITTGSFDTTTISQQVTSKQSETGSTAADTMSTVETISVSSEVKVNTSFIKDQSHVSLDGHNVTDSKYVVGTDASQGVVVSDPSIDLPPPPSPHGSSEMKATSSLPGDTQQTSTYEVGTEKVTPKVKEQSVASDVTVQLGALGSESEAGVPIAYGLSNQLNGRKQNTIIDSGVIDNSVAPKQRGTGIEGEVDLNTITLDNSLSSAKGHFVSMGSMVDTSKIGTAGGFNIPTDVFMEDPQSKGSENSLSVNMAQGKTIGGVVISGMKSLPEYTLSDQRSTKDTSGVGVLHEETKTPPPPVVFGADITTSSVTTDMKEMPQAYSTQGIVTERTSVHSGFESTVAQDQSVVSDAGAGVTSPTVVQDVSTDSVHVDTSSASPAMGPVADTPPPDQSIISQSGAVSIDTTPEQTAGTASETFEIHQAPTPSDQPKMVEPHVGTDSSTAGTPVVPDHSVSTGIGNVEIHSGVDVTVGVDKGAHGTPPDPYPIGDIFTGSVTVSTQASVDQTIGSDVPQYSVPIWSCRSATSIWHD
ncbi:hypothetical protein FSP39_000119 [Pinctada imbricata]|uniref:Uncharacterized protein n=1 Tax=Pinctada imbricata TaxID=66713 RepID=A0AA89BV73_PINIB|nr:hypothetical protein FSP39_000119 [Pinctada imbricata]